MAKWKMPPERREKIETYIELPLIAELYRKAGLLEVSTHSLISTALWAYLFGKQVDPDQDIEQLQKGGKK